MGITSHQRNEDDGDCEKDPLIINFSVNFSVVFSIFELRALGLIFDGCEDISSDSDDSHIRHDNEISRQQEFRGFQIRILIQFGFQRGFEQFIFSFSL